MGIHGLASLLDYFVDLKLDHNDPKVLECKAEFDLEPRYFDAIEAGDIDAVQYLLDAGMSSNMMNSFSRFTAMGQACDSGRLDVAKLLRAHGAYLVAFYEDEPSPNEPSEDLLQRTKGHDVRAWLLSQPPAGEYLFFPSPPPAGRAPATEGTTVADWYTALREYRRQLAHERAPEHWDRLRKHFAMRATALYWQERTQVRLCAPDGAARKADKEAFETDLGAVRSSTPPSKDECEFWEWMRAIEPRHR